MDCTKCGEELEPGARFCGDCLEPVPEPPPAPVADPVNTSLDESEETTASAPALADEPTIGYGAPGDTWTGGAPIPPAPPPQPARPVSPPQPALASALPLVISFNTAAVFMVNCRQSLQFQLHANKPLENVTFVVHLNDKHLAKKSYRNLTAERRNVKIGITPRQHGSQEFQVFVTWQHGDEQFSRESGDEDVMVYPESANIAELLGAVNYAPNIQNDGHAVDINVAGPGDILASIDPHANLRDHLDKIRGLERWKQLALFGSHASPSSAPVIPPRPPKAIQRQLTLNIDGQFLQLIAGAGEHALGRDRPNDIVTRIPEQRAGIITLRAKHGRSSALTRTHVTLSVRHDGLYVSPGRRSNGSIAQLLVDEQVVTSPKRLARSSTIKLVSNRCGAGEGLALRTQLGPLTRGQPAWVLFERMDGLAESYLILWGSFPVQHCIPGRQEVLVRDGDGFQLTEGHASEWLVPDQPLSTPQIMVTERKLLGLDLPHNLTGV